MPLTLFPLILTITIKGFQTIVFIFIIISTTFRPICLPAFFTCLSTSGTFTELRTTSFIETTGVACSDSVSHNQVQVLSIPVLLLPTDKGEATVVMDRMEYYNKLADLIGNGGYCKVKKDPTLKMERKLYQIFGKNKDLIPQTKYRQLILHYSKLPHIYGLPKIYKDGIPLRPIVSNWGSVCHRLICILVEIISPLTGKSSSYIKNSAHFVEIISDGPIHSNQIVSLDVVSLFTKVPTDETLAVVWDKLAADPFLEEPICIPIDNLMEMLTFCVETTYFGMGSDIYQQEEGLAMGSPLSPVLANIYMEIFKEMALGSTSLKPSMWLRYVDDTFILWCHQEDVQLLLDHVNSIRPSIQFTMEITNYPSSMY